MALVQDMVNNPTTSFGFHIQLTNEVFYASMIFASSDYTDSTLWPEITIEYETPDCIERTLSEQGGEDAYIGSYDATGNYANHEEIAGDAWTCGGAPCFGRGLFKFDLTAIPAGADITSASLDLYANPAPLNGAGIAMNGANASWIQRVTSPWTESTVTWNTAPTVTTTNQVTLPQSSGQFQNYPDIDVTNLIQDMIDNPGTSHGFMIRLVNETYYASMIFASSDYPDPGYHPLLEVCWVSTIGINETENLVASTNVYPNPFNDKVSIDIDLKTNATVSFELVDITGRTIIMENKGNLSTGKHSLELNNGLSNLADAAYFLMIHVNEKFIVKKLMKN
jgi:hypothetical protein